MLKCTCHLRHKKNMIVLTYLTLLVAAGTAAPGYFHLGIGSDPYHTPLVSPPVYPEPIYKTFPPIYSPPVVKSIQPVFAPPQVLSHIQTPIIVKTVPASTSYTTFTQVHVPQTIAVKTILAPQPILKSCPIPAHYSYGFSPYH